MNCPCKDFRNRRAPCGACGAPAPGCPECDRIAQFIRSTAERRFPAAPAQMTERGFGSLGDETAWEAFASQGT